VLPIPGVGRGKQEFCGLKANLEAFESEAGG